MNKRSVERRKKLKKREVYSRRQSDKNVVQREHDKERTSVRELRAARTEVSIKYEKLIVLVMDV